MFLNVTCPGVLALGDWKPYGAALEKFLQQVACHSLLSKNKAVEDFLTSAEVRKAAILLLVRTVVSHQIISFKTS